ncbi:MAG: alpha/beta hydrolase-fold protein [Mariniblastus sp.]|nr:alpha/beta hydrolase-fold protein [Mariniblastus sp.]
MNTFSLMILTLFGLLADRSTNEVPVVHKMDAERQKQTKFLNPEYLVFLPEKVAEGKKIPLLIYLHGAGGRGSEIRKVRGQALPVWRGIQKFNKGPCIVVVPQVLAKVEGAEKSIWEPNDLDQLLAQLKATLPVDPQRVYLTGNSMGGYGTWVWAANAPQHFAAVAPISGGIGRGGPKDVTEQLDQWAKKLAQVPLYAFAGGKDKVVPAERSERVVKAIRQAGGQQAKLKVYPEQGHNARQVVLSTPEFYEWMFSKQRK